jgi:hypothetical protein
MMRLKEIFCTAAILAALMLVGIAAAASWYALGEDSEPAGTVAYATGRAVNPIALRVYIGGINVSGYAHVNCAVNQVHKTEVTNYSGSGYHTVHMPYSNPDTCIIYATAGSDTNGHSVLIEADE